MGSMPSCFSRRCFSGGDAEILIVRTKPAVYIPSIEHPAELTNSELTDCWVPVSARGSRRSIRIDRRRSVVHIRWFVTVCEDPLPASACYGSLVKRPFWASSSLRLSSWGHHLERPAPPPRLVVEWRC